MPDLPACISDLLTSKQLSEVQELSAEIDEAWQNQTIWRTYTEATTSVLNDLKFPTRAAKYHQSVREQLVFWENLVALSFDYREAQIDLAEVEENLKTSEGFERQRQEVKRDRLRFNIAGMLKQAEERIREIKMWSQIKKDLDDGSFDTKDKDTDQLLGLTLRYIRELPAAKKSKNAGEAINIVGQAATMLKECQRRGIADKLGVEGRRAQKMLGGK